MNANEVLMRRAPFLAKRKQTDPPPPRRKEKRKCPVTPPLTHLPSHPCNSRSISPTIRRSSTLSSLKTRTPVKQAYIDIGQKGFGRHQTCVTCGLLYTIGQEEDEREHQRFCKKKQQGITMSTWKVERLHQSFPDEQARIIEIRASDPSLHVKKLLEAKTVLDDALGFVEEELFLTRGHFYYIQARQIIGCLTTERIKEAFTLDSINKDHQQPTKVQAVLGICQIWVHPDHRHKSIATRLVDVAREKSIYGLVVAKNRIAFVQPTRDGLGFATKYLHPHPLLVT